MLDRIIEIVLAEAKWIPFALFVSLAVATTWGLRRHRAGQSDWLSLAPSLAYGCLLGILGFGHVLAVGIKLAQGSLEGSAFLLLALGVVLAVPAWWLVLDFRSEARRRPLLLNGWLALSLLAMGIHNIPIALPGLLNVGLLLHRRRAVGWTLLAITVVGYLGLLIGSLIFAASGQSFEDFSGRT
ncbi:MAG: hypothetical protein AAF533_07515 [Acidobacteriota bacterium]